jgi:hypothetical protein
MKNTKFEIFLETENLNDKEASDLLKHIQRTRRNNEDWIILFFRFIISFYNKLENKQYYADKDEKTIKFSIKKFHKKDRNYSSEFILNLEPSNINEEQEGFYDLKFEHSAWEENYFAMEAKCLDNTSESIKQYIHCHKYLNKIKTEDGGVYRFLSLKYSKDLNFGGMIGFIQKGNSHEIIQKTKESLKMLKLKEANSDEEFGNNLDESLFSKQIENFPNSFYSKHSRKSKKESILLYHIFLDFSK